MRFSNRFGVVFMQFLRFLHCFLHDFEHVFWVLDEFLQGVSNAYAVGHYRDMM